MWDTNLGAWLGIGGLLLMGSALCFLAAVMGV